jgi:hypothetical protein
MNPPPPNHIPARLYGKHKRIRRKAQPREGKTSRNQSTDLATISSFCLVVIQTSQHLPSPVCSLLSHAASCTTQPRPLRKQSFNRLLSLYLPSPDLICFFCHTRTRLKNEAPNQTPACDMPDPPSHQPCRSPIQLYPSYDPRILENQEPPSQGEAAEERPEFQAALFASSTCRPPFFVLE